MHRTAYVMTAQPHPMTRSSSPAVKPKATVFAVTCVLHSLIALFCGSMMMFHSQAIYSLGHGSEAAERLLGSTPHDRLLIGTSDSFAGLLLFAIGLLLLMVSNIQDREFQSFFAKGCFGLHVLVGAWRVRFEAGVEGLAGDCLRQTVGDILLAISWVFVLVYSWIEKNMLKAKTSGLNKGDTLTATYDKIDEKKRKKKVADSSQ